MKLKKLIKEIQDGFEEVTYSDGSDEVMVHFNQNGDPIRAYVYKDSPLINFDYDAYDIPKRLGKYQWKFVPGKNPLFLHLDSSNVGVFVSWLKQMGYNRTDET